MSDIALRCFVCVLALALSALLCVAIYDSVTADTITLRKDQWRCDQSAVATTFTPVLVGKITTLVPSRREQCVVYVTVKAERSP